MEEEAARPLRVFVSHTVELARFPEKRSFVDAVCAAVRRAGGVAVVMADFGARDQRSPEVCEAEVCGCDVYLGVIGFRYGTPVVGRDDGVSYTEFEFEVAGRAGMPRLVFLLDETITTVPVALVDVDRGRINRFRHRLQDERVTVAVVNPDELAARVGEGLATLSRDRWPSREEPPRPWMAPPVDRMVPRPELGGRLIAALSTPGAAEVGLTTGLAGAGGFGKTTLAAWVCHRPEIRRRYPGGLLWVTVGQEIHGADLAEKINDLACALGSRRPVISDPDVAGAELGRLLEEREPVLLVVDDVWDERQLRPFRFGGRACTRLVTTRVPGLLPTFGPRIRVDAMSPDQARALVTEGVAGLPVAMAEQLAAVAGRWPVLLSLVNGLLRRRTDYGQPPREAASEILRRLTMEGPAALDPARPADRARAVGATIEASLTLLDSADQNRYLDLAIFPEDVDIPLDVLELLWPNTGVDRLCDEVTGLGLVADYRLDAPGPRLVLHDVIRAYLRCRRSPEEQTDAHRRLTTAASGLLAFHDEEDGGSRPWWTLPPDAGYLWRHLPHHLAGAHQHNELAALVCDLRWVEAKTQRLGSVIGAVADLALVHTPTAEELRGVLEHDAPLLSPIDPPEALGATLASRVHNVPGLEPVLHRYRPTLPRPRLEPAWPLPDRPDATQPGPTGHTGAITSCAFSPDATLLATSSDDGTARLWQAIEGTERAVLTGHAGGVWDCAFSPDGTLLATTSDDHTARLWNLPDGTLHTVLTGHTDWVQRCAFSPDGALLATVSSDRTARLWRVADGGEHAVLVGHTSGVTGCAFSPDGTLLATSSDDGTARLWHVTDGTQHDVLADHPCGVKGCAFSPDGTLLATAGDDGTTRLWQVPGGAEQTVLTGHTDSVWACVFSPDGALLATAGSGGTVRLWHVRSGATQAVLTDLGAWVRGCAFSPDGTLLATAGNDQTLRLWQVPNGAPQAVLTDSAPWVHGCAFSPDGTLLATTSRDRTARLWRVSDGALQAVLSGHTRSVNRCAFSPDGTLLATTSADRTVRLWHLPEGTPQTVLTGHTGSVRGCAFSPDGTLLATAGRDRTVRLWRIPEGTMHAVLTGHTHDADSCAFSPDGTLLATTSGDQTTRLWQVADNVERTVLVGHTEAVTGCAFSPDGRLLATVSDDRTIRLWRVHDGAPQATLYGHASWIEACAFSPDGALLATVGRDRLVRLWHVATGRCHSALRVASAHTRIAWHPNGRLLCAVGGAGIYLLTYVP
jgi:WD40 repeat protein